VRLPDWEDHIGYLLLDTAQPKTAFQERIMLAPLLAQFCQSGSFQIFRSHGNPELAVGIELEKPRLSERGDSIRVRHRPSQVQENLSRDTSLQACSFPGFVKALDLLSLTVKYPGNYDPFSCCKAWVTACCF
jgi:hypothetical protein